MLESVYNRLLELCRAFELTGGHTVSVYLREILSDMDEYISEVERTNDD